MTVISSREFATNQERYFDIAINEDVFIKRDRSMFQLICNNYEMNREREYYEPDEDFYRSISADEFKDKALKIIDKIYNK